MADKHALRWLTSVPGARLKARLGVLVLLQAVLGGSGVLYAVLLRVIVDGAAARDSREFLRGVVLAALLVAAQIALRALIRWLGELCRAGFENL